MENEHDNPGDIVRQAKRDAVGLVASKTYEYVTSTLEAHPEWELEESELRPKGFDVNGHACNFRASTRSIQACMERIERALPVGTKAWDADLPIEILAERIGGWFIGPHERFIG